MSTSYYWSDPHFFHDNLCKVFTIPCPDCGTRDDCLTCGGSRKVPARPFKDGLEMTEFIIRMHNEVVRPVDHSWCLGDVVMERNAWGGARMVKTVKRLNGHRRVILGNHDQLDPKYYVEAFQKVRGSARVDSLIFSHQPLAIESIPVGCVNVHGHTHTQCLSGPYINVSLEAINYVPQSLEQLQTQARTVRTRHPFWDRRPVELRDTTY